jgi:hypothetical protein
LVFISSPPHKKFSSPNANDQNGSLYHHWYPDRQKKVKKFLDDVHACAKRICGF